MNNHRLMLERLANAIVSSLGLIYRRPMGYALAIYDLNSFKPGKGVAGEYLTNDQLPDAAAVLRAMADGMDADKIGETEGEA